ncbi:MAG: hypothetical protein ACLSAH_08740 [Bilophila wadsworthia]
MIGEANHGTAPDGADGTYTDGVVRRALQTPPKATATTGSATSATSPPCSPGTLRWVNAVWDTVAYGVFFQHMETETHRNRSRATPEEIALGRRAFFAMLDVLKPDFVIVWGLTLFKQHWLSPESGITMFAPASARMSSQIARMSVSGTATTRRGISAMFPNTRNGRPSGNCISADTPPGLIQVSLRVRMPPPGWGPAL